MLQSIGKRDIGQCEVCRLLMSEPLYSSSFEYTTQKLDFKEKSKEIYNDGINQAISKTLMEFYANQNNDKTNENLDKSSFYEYVQKYKVTNGQLTLRRSDNLIIVTYPTVRYNPNILEKYKEYCYYEMIKFQDFQDIPKMYSQRSIR